MPHFGSGRRRRSEMNMNYRVILSWVALLSAQLTGCVVNKDLGNSEATGMESSEVDAGGAEDDSAMQMEARARRAKAQTTRATPRVRGRAAGMAMATPAETVIRVEMVTAGEMEIPAEMETPAETVIRVEMVTAGEMEIPAETVTEAGTAAPAETATATRNLSASPPAGCGTPTLVTTGPAGFPTTATPSFRAVTAAPARTSSTTRAASRTSSAPSP